MQRQAQFAPQWHTLCVQTVMKWILWLIAAALLVLWIVGFALRIAGAAIHVLLVLAIVMAIVSFFAGMRTGSRGGI